MIDKKFIKDCIEGNIWVANKTDGMATTRFEIKGQENAVEEIMEQHLKVVEGYKQLCRMAEVPEIFIEYGGIPGEQPTEADIAWAKQKIEEIKNRK